jgi:putative colanic acid biosysnthesis UDP-glucose lipid carrier transferase
MFNRGIQQQWSALGALYRALDALCVGAALWLASRHSPETPGESYLLAGAMAIVIHGLFAELSGMYRSWRGVSTGREIVAALGGWGCTMLALLALGFATGRTGEFTRHAMLIWLAATPLMIVACRMAARRLLQWLRKMGYNTQGFAIVGVTDLGFQLAQNIENLPEMGLKLIGYYDDRPEERNPHIPQNLGRRVGNLDELVEQARAGKIHYIYITFPMRAERRIRAVLERLGDTTASVYIVPDFFVFELLHSRWTDILGLPAVSIFENPLYGIDGLAKRLCDLCLGSLILLAASPIMAFCALLIELTSPGPVFFRQKRYGLDGREIRVWKFRTMSVCEEGPAAVQATKNDPRVTPIGRILRKTSLDELPQLFNVIGGSMSLVGPRPHPQALNEQFRPLIQGYMLRHKIKPGMTGLAQVSGWRGETDSPEKMLNRIQCDHRYIREWSLWLDLKILVKTAYVVFSGRNAY